MASYTMLQSGSSGSEVKKLQEALIGAGYDVGSAGADGIYGSATESAVKKYQEANGLSVDGIAGDQTLGKLYTSSGTSETSTDSSKTTGFQYKHYAESDTVKKAEQMLSQQLANKPGEYSSPWQTQLNDIMNKILNREDFTYDLNGDALYQQYKDQYVTQGRMAMMDTMGQAAALTGGYGNSYAQSVGQQAYQGYLQGLNDKVPELYQLALDKYNMDGDRLYDQYALLGSREEQDYGRHRDTVSDWQTEADRLQNQFYAERDYDYNRYTDGRDFAYGTFSDDRAYDYQVGRDKVADEQWLQEFNEAVRQFNLEHGDKYHSSGGGGGGYSGGGGGGGGGNPTPTPTPEPGMTATEEKMDTYVRNMLNNATSSQFNPQQVINASKYSSEEKAVAQQILNEYISSGAMKTGGKL